jgi:hypothetical protein
MRYYFYTLNEEVYHENKSIDKMLELEDELLVKASNTNNKKEIALFMHGVSLSHKIRHDRSELSKRYEFQNGQDARKFRRYGVKEIDKEVYDLILEDDKKIVSGFNQKTLDLMDKFGHKEDGWHFPFYVDAENKSHLKWKLKQMFSEYKQFILK